LSARPVTNPADHSRLERWLDALLATPGLTSLADREAARRLHIEDALAAEGVLERGPVVDVGSGGGSPGIPLAAARPDLAFVLLESNARKCRFLEGVAGNFPNVRVVCARAEEYGSGEGRDAYGTAVARALAPPSVALEWCLPLVAVGGLVVLYTGEPDLEPLAAVAARLGGGLPKASPVTGSTHRHLVIVRKVAPTPPGFPRRAGAARKRPLA
jgi:16S rRNA (guanine527-N7)-methyltransferase